MDAALLKQRSCNFVTNANGPQVADYSLLAGVGFFVASALTPQGDANAAQYTFGTHAQAIHQAEGVKSKVFTPVLAQGRVRPFIYAQQDNPFQPQPSIFQSAAATAVATTAVASFITAGPQLADFTLQGQIKAPGPAPQGAVPPLTNAAPQLADLSLQPWLDSPLIISQGAVPPIVKAAPQDDPTQIAPSVAKSQPAATNPIAGYVTVPPQNEERPTRQIFPSVVSGQTPPVIAQIFAGPQQVDLTLQGSIFPPALTPIVVSYAFRQVYASPQSIDLTLQGSIFPTATAKVSYGLAQLYASPQAVDLTQQGWIRGTPLGAQGAVPPLTVGGPQADPTQIQPQIVPTAATPPAITGVTVTPIPPVPPQFDPSANPSVIWTPSTFSPSTPTPPSQVTFGRRFPRALAFVPNQLERDAQHSAFESLSPVGARSSSTTEIETGVEARAALRARSKSDYAKETTTDIGLLDDAQAVLRDRSWFDLRPDADQDHAIVITDPTYQAESLKPITDAEVLAAMKFLR